LGSGGLLFNVGNKTFPRREGLRPLQQPIKPSASAASRYRTLPRWHPTSSVGVFLRQRAAFADAAPRRHSL